MGEEKKFRIPGHIILTQEELTSLVVCIFLDIVEYIFQILLLPLAGDIMDIGGIVLSLYFFRWVGLITLIELIPGGDILPMYIITWVIWYLLKKIEETRTQERYR